MARDLQFLADLGVTETLSTAGGGRKQQRTMSPSTALKHTHRPPLPPPIIAGYTGGNCYGLQIPQALEIY